MKTRSQWFCMLVLSSKFIVLLGSHGFLGCSRLGYVWDVKGVSVFGSGQCSFVQQKTHKNWGFQLRTEMSRGHNNLAVLESDLINDRFPTFIRFFTGKVQES